MNIKRTIYFCSLFTLLVVIGLLILGYLSSYIGWYGYKKWEYRVASTTIVESKERGVFITRLNYRYINFNDSQGRIEPFIERGFHFGKHSSKETEIISNTSFPFQLSFDYTRSSNVGVVLSETELRKFDSSNATTGFLKQAKLSDTITASILGEKIKNGQIKIWQ